MLQAFRPREAADAASILPLADKHQVLGQDPARFGLVDLLFTQVARFCGPAAVKGTPGAPPLITRSLAGPGPGVCDCGNQARLRRVVLRAVALQRKHVRAAPEAKGEEFV